MPRFYFNLQRDDVIVADQEGEIFPDIDNAGQEAITAAREMLVEAILSGNEPPDSIHVMDGNGETILTIVLADMLPNSLRR